MNPNTKPYQKPQEKYLRPIFLQEEEDLLYTLQRDRVKQLFVYDVFFNKMDFEKVEKEVLSVYRRKGFIRFDILAYDHDDGVEPMRKLLTIDIP